MEKFVYVTLFHLLLLEPEKCDIPELHVREWVWSKSNPYQSPDLVKAEQIGWGVPTIQRLWFGYVFFSKHSIYYKMHLFLFYQ
jgi:hypothetical protein